MATQKEIQLCQEMLGLAIKINMQGKYHVFASYSGHVHWFELRVLSAPHSSDGNPIAGWGGACDPERETYVTLSTDYKLGFGEEMADVIEYKIERLEKLKADLLTLLDTDADGVPV